MSVTGAPRIRTEVQVMFFDTDCGGVVHNIAYLRFIEIARTLLAEQLGLALSEMVATQKYPVVIRTEIDYRRAAKLGDRLTIEGWLDQLERVRFWCAFRIVRTDAGVNSNAVGKMAALARKLGPISGCGGESSLKWSRALVRLALRKRFSDHRHCRRRRLGTRSLPF